MIVKISNFNWFALIKVVTIVLMIIAGLGLILFGIGNGGNPIGISNLWSHGGFMPNGFIGFFFALSIVIGSYQGVELIGISAVKPKSSNKYCKGSQRSDMENFNFLYWCNFCHCISISLEPIR